MSRIKKIDAWEILDSRGDPTIEAEITLDDSVVVTASVPSGASVGSHESFQLRDNDHDRYNGLGVLKAIENIKQIIGPKLFDFEVDQQEKIDQTMINLDGTENKKKLGGNSILAVSLAVCKAAAQSRKEPLYKYISSLFSSDVGDFSIPTPMFNLINGGKHGAGNLDFQEFFVIPSAEKSYREALEIGEEIRQSLKNVLIAQNAGYGIGDEGGFVPNFSTNSEAFENLVLAGRQAGFQLGLDYFLGMDAAATTFYTSKGYTIKDQIHSLDSDEIVNFYHNLIDRYHLLLIEDPLAENDWPAWIKLTSMLSDASIIVADDLTVTNPSLCQRAIDEKAATGIIIKPNQIGTLTETLKVVKIAKLANWKIVISHRSGETNDSFVADLAVGVRADFAKFGAPVRGERVAKYNRLSEIEDELKNP